MSIKPLSIKMVSLLEDAIIFSWQYIDMISKWCFKSHWFLYSVFKIGKRWNFIYHKKPILILKDKICNFISMLSIYTNSIFSIHKNNIIGMIQFDRLPLRDENTTGAWGMDFVSSSPLFQNFHINHSFFKIFIIIRFFFIWQHQ